MNKELKLSILGVNIEIRLENWLPLQSIYDLVLAIRWKINNVLGTNQDKEFIKFALRFLPETSFVVFSFDNKGDNFIQLSNLGGKIAMILPIWTTNCYHGKKRELIKVLNSQKIKRQYSKSEFFKPKQGCFALLPDWNVHNKQIKVNLGNDYEKAAKITLLIAEKVFKNSKPCLQKYDSTSLIWIA